MARSRLLSFIIVWRRCFTDVSVATRVCRSLIFNIRRRLCPLKIEKGGMAIRNMGAVALTAFACSLAAQLKHMATFFFEWTTLGQQGALLQISHEASLEMSAQVLHYVGEYRRRVPQGLFKENDFSAILKSIVDLESGKNVNSSETQLQSGCQILLSGFEVVQEPSRRRTSQSALYSDFVEEELKRLLMRSKARVDASSEDCNDYDRVRHMNWLSSINQDSGAWGSQLAYRL